MKRIEQESRIIKEFVQEFRKVARESKYEKRPLIEGFKREINRIIKRKLMDAKRPFGSIEQWYKRATNLDRY